MLRRLRGIFAFARLWAAIWGFAGGLCYAIAGVTWTLELGQPLSIYAVLPYAVTGALFLALYGTLSGIAFAVCLALAERRRTIHDLSTPRIATWGALGGGGILLLNVASLSFTDAPLPTDTVPVLLVMSLLGAGCAAGSLAMARRAPDPGVAGSLGAEDSGPGRSAGAPVISGDLEEAARRTHGPA